MELKLLELVKQMPDARVQGDVNVEITGISMHSQHVRPGDLFVCVPGIPGLQEDRHPYAGAAARAGAVAIVAERDVDAEVPVIRVPSARLAMAMMAAHLNGHPSRSLKLIGVTGTNGKTTTCHMIEAILAHAGHRTGLMGNLGTKIGSESQETKINTQDPPQLQANLRRMRDDSVEYAVMEASSQGLHMSRVQACSFRAAVFTNLTQDHLDYHGTMEAYLDAKAILFRQLGSEPGPTSESSPKPYAVLNADDPASVYLRRQTAGHVEVRTYGFAEEADVRAAEVELTAQGTRFELQSWKGSFPIVLPMVGRFNVSNALAAITVALMEDVPLPVIREGMERFSGVPGRMEIIDAGQPYLVLADYAHSPDGLEKALSTLREFARGKVLTVFGCGGQRDRAKRPVMGEVVARYSDIVVATSDNPRKEDPHQILADIEEGFRNAGYTAYELIENRRDAIGRAIRLAAPGDIVLIAGKGHETYQIGPEGTVHFDDREEARIAMLWR
ncbi:UDP-N-acetylmuramoyl-L-alanyl-D-glutamate--2,6-diaminopimelate ligase [Paenibacillus sp. HJGM_3]|uniref:UDP-N-acetylmuramoyl-L-alanyl-D-glutamate--2, 6-diaminopimelate ligase n=1 Tax=Paenibacillus sp. HJGM_3 TaxID=3379816 RepID=UPI00385AA9A3